MVIGVEGSAKNPARELRRKWQSLKAADMPEAQVKSRNMFSHGEAGFNSDDDKNDCSFKAGSSTRSCHLLGSGQRVSFYIGKNLDPDKQDIVVFFKPEGLQ